MTIIRRGAVALCSLLLLSGLGLTPASATGHRSTTDDKPQKLAVPVAKSMSLLCSGYSGCKAKGMGNAGYGGANGKMYWRMYSGHNCTNYVAYRMVRNGMSEERPWSGGGNAEYWGLYNRSLTNDTPAVGAVAWWAENVRPAGSSGHVAYVEQVISADEIIVSQDSWGGDFSWARITREGGSWPSGFVHFNDIAFDNTTPPSLTGTPKVGGVLTASSGAWSPTSTDTAYTYAWRAGRTPVTRSTRSTLKLRSSEQGKRVSVVVTAKRPGFAPATARSTRTSVVEPGVFTSTVAPVVRGTPEVDQVLSVSSGTWTPAPATLSYQWLRDGTPVPEATGSSYAVGPDDVDHAFTVRVTASRPGYDDVSTVTAATSPVALADLVVDHPGTLRGKARLGHTLVLDPGSYSPGDATTTITWFRGGEPIEGATGTTYVLSAADLGHRITTTLDVTRPGYHALTETSPGTRPVKTTPTLRARYHHPGHGRLDLTVRLAAEGVDVVRGKIRVVSHGEVIREFAVRTGTRSISMRHLSRGKRRVKLHYLATDTVTRAVLRKVVRVR